MGFRNGAYATVWAIEQDSDTHTKIRISIDRKNRDTGEYEQDFSGFVDCYGREAAVKAAKLSERDRIQIGSCDVRSVYNKEKQQTYYYFKIFAFEQVSQRSDGVDNGEPDNNEPEPKKSGGKKPLPF